MGCTLNFLIGLLFTLAMLLGINFRFLQAPASDLTSLPCTVITVRPDVPVRVGPGEDRAVRLFLPVNDPIPVSGQATIDGAGWWQIELTGVEQAWISQADVDSAGDCASVLDTEAPPVIPGQAPAETIIDEPAGGTSGEWGACGSCESCGGPAEQCVTSPEGQCVWDATRCGGLGTDGPAETEVLPQPTDEGPPPGGGH